MQTRRKFIKLGAAGGAGFYLASKLGARPRVFAEAIPGGTLDPAGIPKFITSLPIPGPMPVSKRLPGNIDFYDIALRQFQQQILPKSMPKTTVWSYGSVDAPATFHTPAFTIEANYRRRVRVRWSNELVDKFGRYLPHILPVDQTIHWANPPGGLQGRDGHGHDDMPYTGPVPMVPHLHGAHVTPESDGYPNAWFLPDARNIPTGYAKVGSWYTRYEIPLVFQDRSFNTDGSLFYPDNRAFFEGLDKDKLLIPFMPHGEGCGGEMSDIAPIWNPEFFGNAMMVNGATWPYLKVEQRRYRFRLLNACGSRFLILRLSNGQSFWQVGNDGGFLPSAVEQSELLIAPAERVDVIIDFTNVPRGTEIVLQNWAPDEPFGGGVPGIDFDPSDPDSTGLVLQFRVVRASGAGSANPRAG
jgi:bilirubin oxidase